jgi:hypothetical protein
VPLNATAKHGRLSFYLSSFGRCFRVASGRGSVGVRRLTLSFNTTTDGLLGTNLVAPKLNLMFAF